MRWPSKCCQNLSLPQLVQKLQCGIAMAFCFLVFSHLPRVFLGQVCRFRHCEMVIYEYKKNWFSLWCPFTYWQLNKTFGNKIFLSLYTNTILSTHAHNLIRSSTCRPSQEWPAQLVSDTIRDVNRYHCKSLMQATLVARSSAASRSVQKGSQIYSSSVRFAS